MPRGAAPGSSGWLSPHGALSASQSFTQGIGTTRVWRISFPAGEASSLQSTRCSEGAASATSSTIVNKGP